MPKLTKQFVEKLRPDPQGDYVAWDDRLPGFGVRVWPSSKRTYIAKYRTEDGRQRKLTIGQHGAFTVEQARDAARRTLIAARLGNDPAKDRQEARKAPSVGDLAERYLRDHAYPKKGLRSAEGDETLLRLHVLPRLGGLKLNGVTRQDVIWLHKEMEATPGAANRTLALLSKMFNLAERWGFRADGSNPCRHIDKYPERKLERYLSPEELRRLGDVLDEVEQSQEELPSVIAAIRLLLMTGCRRNEILLLRWSQVDFDRRVLRLDESKTGPKTVYLSEPALYVLRHIERTSNPFVITGGKPGSHLVNLRRAWCRIRTKAGLCDVRLHDLRHTYASYAAASGLSLPIIGKLLGHTQPATTARYAHLADNPLVEASEKTGICISGYFRADKL